MEDSVESDNLNDFRNRNLFCRRNIDYGAKPLAHRRFANAGAGVTLCQPCDEVHRQRVSKQTRTRDE